LAPSLLSQRLQRRQILRCTEVIILAESKPAYFNVEVRGGNLVVSLPNGRFAATYYKPAGKSHLILRERTKTDDEEMVADALHVAVRRARELGWIV
jgi:hypothetical protein